MNGGIIWQFPTRSTQSISFRRSTWISLRRVVWLVHWHAPYRLITLVLMSLFIMDIDWVLHHFTMSLWRTFGALICSRFVVGGMFWLCSRCRRNWRFYCFWSAGSLWRTWCLLWWCTYLFFSRVGLSVSSNQVNNFNWTENTLSNTGESFAAETNLSASGYIIFFSDFAFCISFSVLKKWQSLEETIWGWPQLQHMMSLVQSKPSWSSSPHLRHVSSPLHWPLPCPNFLHRKHRTGFGKYGLTCTL